MRTGRQPGEDMFVAETLKFGGAAFRHEVYKLVCNMWEKAATSEDGSEADGWPESWKLGLVVPLWKKKGSPRDKNTWRGITLLSVGSKLLARAVATIISTWSEDFLGEEQYGFRSGRGTDDALQVSRRLIEEASTLSHGEPVMMAFFDIEKAYPRVCRPALWRLMQARGCPEGMLKVCKALHDHSAYKVRAYRGLSSAWTPQRGLRQECPSSPPLF